LYNEGSTTGDYMTHTQDEAKAATPHHDLIAELLNPNTPKTEREHAASREIERLQALEAPVQDVKELFGYEIWGCFYRTFDEALEAFKDQGIQWATSDGVFNGMNEEWVKENIREVYVHGTPAIAKREAEAKKGQP
jgi:hypothetical protein